MNNKKMSPVRLLSLGYLITIILGTLLLMLPFSSQSREVTPFIDSLFTATSATCVTGLVTVATYSHWSLFGQIIILILIQIGGLGFMTIITLIFMVFKKSISLYNSTVLMQSAGTYNISEVTKLIKRIFIGTLLFEGLGAIILTIVFSRDMQIGDAIYKGIFHSISAFCNAGFDILGDSSLIAYKGNYVLLITIMTLIVIGGLGFIVWSDIIDNKFNLRKMQLHTKIVLIGTSLLIFIPALLFYIFEFTNFGHVGNFQDMQFGEKILNSFFLAISPRTAGFSSLDLTQLTGSGILLTIILMFIGGCSGSTAGGIKVTTFIILLANLFASAKGYNKVVMFKRQIPSKIIKQSSSLFLAYIILVILATLVISSMEVFTFEEVLFEVVSAIGTVGLSLGVSSSAGILTKLILIFLMFAGRIGALALFSVFINEKNENNLDEPKGKIVVG